MDTAVATTLVLVRHGQTDWNAETRLQGHQNPPLNALGVQQAEELARALDGESFDALYSSDLRRAVQTAEAIVARQQDLQMHTSPHLRERRLGVLEGLTLAEAAQLQPEAFQQLRSKDDTLRAGGGESLREMRERVVAEMERIAAAHPGQTVLVVAHGGVLHAAYKHTTGSPYPGTIGNASLHRVRVQGRTWALMEWNAKTQAQTSSQFGGGINEG